MDNEISREEFLDKKRDFSPLLVHLTRDGIDEMGNPYVPAKEVLRCILDEKILRAYNYYCIFQDKLRLLDRCS